MAKYFKLVAKRIVAGAACVSLAFPLVTSCQEGHSAGDLLGNWCMNDDDAKYVAFSGGIALFRYTDHAEIYGNFQHVGDSLFIQCYSISPNLQESDRDVVENQYGFRPFSDIRVKIEALDSDHLVLSKNGRLWNFYKY